MIVLCFQLILLQIASTSKDFTHQILDDCRLGRCLLFFLSLLMLASATSTYFCRHSDLSAVVAACVLFQRPVCCCREGTCLDIATYLLM